MMMVHGKTTVKGTDAPTPDVKAKKDNRLLTMIYHDGGVWKTTIFLRYRTTLEVRPSLSLFTMCDGDDTLRDMERWTKRPFPTKGAKLAKGERN